MLQEEGFLGPHSPKLTVGDFQSMVFEIKMTGLFICPLVVDPTISVKKNIHKYYHLLS
jgi:hypothetical protein